MYHGTVLVLTDLPVCVSWSRLYTPASHVEGTLRIRTVEKLVACPSNCVTIIAPPDGNNIVNRASNILQNIITGNIFFYVRNLCK